MQLMIYIIKKKYLKNASVSFTKKAVSLFQVNKTVSEVPHPR